MPYYAAADVYVHPTFYDPCSLVVLEAAASGLPVITTLANGASDLLHDGLDSVLLSDPGDAEELARQMQRLGDGPLRRAMGAAARRTALEHTLAHNVDQILAVYQEAIALRQSTLGPREVPLPQQTRSEVYSCVFTKVHGNRTGRHPAELATSGSSRESLPGG